MASNNISNYRPFFYLVSDKDFRDLISTIKTDEFNSFNKEDKKIVLSDICGKATKIISDKLNINILNLPNIKLSGDIDNNSVFGKYEPSDCIIYLNENEITPGKLMHEYRHFLQHQLEEKSFIEGVKTPLSEPFYWLQSHERNAYHFQSLFFDTNIFELFIDVKETILCAKDLFLLGYLNKETFNLQRHHAKDYNIMNDIELNQTFVSKETFQLENYDIAIYNDRFFNIKRGNDFIDFQIKDNKCTIFTISTCDCTSLVYQFVTQNNNIDKFNNLEIKYKNLCSDFIDLAANFCKVYNAKEIEINPNTPAVHKNKYSKILGEIKKTYIGVPSDEPDNFLSDPTPHKNTVNQLQTLLFKSNIKNNAKDISHSSLEKILDEMTPDKEKISNNIYKDDFDR